MVCDKSLESQIPEHLRHLLRYESSPLLGHEREALSSEELIEEKNRFLKDIEPHLEEIEIWLVGLFRYPHLKARYQGFFKTLIVRFRLVQEAIYCGTCIDKDRLKTSLLRGIEPGGGEMSDAWAMQCIFKLLNEAPETAWQILIEFIDSCDRKSALSGIGERALSPLFDQCGNLFFGRAAERCETNTKFLYAFACMTIEPGSETFSVWKTLQGSFDIR